jgi:hypothetical protein
MYSSLRGPLHISTAVCTCAVTVAGPEPLLLAAPKFCGVLHQLAARVPYEIACVAYEAAYVACLQRLTDLRYALSLFVLLATRETQCGAFQ